MEISHKNALLYVLYVGYIISKMTLKKTSINI